MVSWDSQGSSWEFQGEPGDEGGHEKKVGTETENTTELVNQWYSQPGLCSSSVLNRMKILCLTEDSINGFLPIFSFGKHAGGSHLLS